MATWLREVNEWALFFGVLALLILAAELGFRIARHVDPQRHEVSSQVSAVQGAVLGLLALLLGFTFSLAMARFEARKELVRDEANAIGTTYLRARLLPEPMQTHVAALLREYVETRFELHDVSFLPERVRVVHLRTSALQTKVWDQAVAAAKVNPDSEMTSLFVASLNDTIDMHGKRMAAIRNHIPAPIFYLLFWVALASLGLTGYASGPSHLQAFTLNSLVALLITAVIILVVDLHRPARGAITVEMSNMSEVRESMHPSAR